jgi:hypothetical protein
MEKILAKKERKNAGKLVPPEFLFLENVKYWLHKNFNKL